MNHEIDTYVLTDVTHMC